MAPPRLPTTVQRRRREKKKKTFSHVRTYLCIFSGLCLACLVWLSTTALPSTSHDRDPHILIRLQEFKAHRKLNQSMNMSEPNKTVHNVSIHRPTQEEREAMERERKREEKRKARAKKKGPRLEHEFVQAINAVTNKTLVKEENESTIAIELHPPLNSKESKLAVKIVKKKQCDSRSGQGDVVAFHYEARTNNIRGNIFAKSNKKENAAKLKLGKSSPFPPGLAMGLLGVCPGERVGIKIPHDLSFGKHTDPRFRLTKGNEGFWNVDIVSVDQGKDETDGEDDDDDDIEDDYGVSSPEEQGDSAFDMWKKVLGMLVQKDQIVSTNVTTTSYKTVYANITLPPLTNGTNTSQTVINHTNALKVVNATFTADESMRATLKPQPVHTVKVVNTTIKVWKDISTPPRSTAPTRLPLHPAIPYLGVLVDGGRHYFPLEWLKKLVDQLYMLRYNFIHLRLTDDQSFNIKLKSHPELAVPAPPTAEDSQSSNPVWTVEEMRELVKYANAKNITIMPEINAPGHCASWGGIPNLIIPCPEFSCEKGYGVPLNETNPKLMEVISDVIEEVLDIFDTSYYLHLGGDEVHMSSACYDEIGDTIPDYNNFEVNLQQVLRDLDIAEERVVRWETTGQKGIDTRAGKVTQWWEAFPKGKRKDGIFFVSQGLYMDSCGERAAAEFFQHGQKLVREDPKAIIAGTFELSTHWWVDRNVFGRLLAVAMGVSQEGQQLRWSPEMYIYFCEAQGWDPKICKNDGRPLLHTNEWLRKWKAHWVTWKAATCDRLTEEYDLRVMTHIGEDEWGRQVTDFDREIRDAQDQFWENFGQVADTPHTNRSASASDEDVMFHSAVPHLGASLEVFAFDDVNGTEGMLKDIIDILPKLGFNLIHLRLLDDSSFPVKLESHPNIAWDGTLVQTPSRRRRSPDVLAFSNEKVLTVNTTRDFVEYAEKIGLKVMPEMSIAARAGGLFSSGLVAKCPNIMCDTDFGLPLDITRAPLLSVLSNVIFELRSIFTSEYIHLGYDERKESQACFDELEISPNFDLFEEKLTKMLDLQGIPPENILRWESSEGLMKRRRAGNITHYQTLPGPPKKNETKPFWASWLTTEKTEPFFVSTGLDFDSVDNATDAWSIYQHTRNLVKNNPIGILAGYLTADIRLWAKLNALGKLVAVAIGASDLGKMDENKFREVYNKTCYDLNITTCELFGRADNTTSPEVVVSDQRELKSKCDMLTHMETRRRSAPGVKA